MKFDLFNKNLQLTRENYVKQFRFKKEIKITPCDKFVACLCKLTQGYVLALKDTGTEIMQVASHNDIEFYEGYELTPNYSDSVRLKLCENIKKSYLLAIKLINSLNQHERLDNDNKYIVNDIKLNTNVISDIINNIYQYITMTDDNIEIDYDNTIPNNIKDLLNYIRKLLIDLIENLINTSSLTIIDFVTKTIDSIITKLFNYYNMLFT